MKKDFDALPALEKIFIFEKGRWLTSTGRATSRRFIVFVRNLQRRR